MMAHMGEYGWVPMMAFGMLFMALFWDVSSTKCNLVSE